MDYPSIFHRSPNRYEAGLSFDSYAMAPAVNASLLKEPTALHMWYNLQIPATVRQSELTEGKAFAFAQGEMIHKFILEPHLAEGGAIEEYFQYAPGATLTSLKAIAAFEADPTRPLVTPGMREVALRIRDVVYKHKMLAKLLSVPADKEMTGYAWDEEAQLMRKIRMDFRPHSTAAMPNNWILDVKSTRDGLTKGKFFHTCRTLGYGVQGSYYQDTDAMITGEVRPNYLIAAVCTEQPYHARLFGMDCDEDIDFENLLIDGRKLYQERMAIFTTAAGEFTRRVKEKHPDPAGAWEAYENEMDVVRLRKRKGSWD